MVSGMDELKGRLEILLGAKPIAPLDETAKQQAEADSREAAERRERVSAAGGELLGAAFKFLGELVASQSPQPAQPRSPRSCATAWPNACRRTRAASSG